MARAHLVGAIVLTVLVALPGCKRNKERFEQRVSATGGAPGAVSAPVASNGPERTPPSEQAAQAVRERLERDPGVDATGIRVASEQGAIELTGTAPNLLSKLRATKIAQATRAVTSVDNRVEVKAPAVADDELVLRVTQALELDPATESLQVKPEARNGLVTLMGTVDSWVEREAAERAAMRVRGVRMVQNVLGVSTQSTRPDSEIERDVESRLRWDVLIGDGQIDVDVKDGTVILKGYVGSAVERERAYRAAGLIAGAKNVRYDELAVRWWAKDEELRRRAGETSDREIHDAIRVAALFDPRVKAYDIKPFVKDGHVTLTGRVDNALAKAVAETLAQQTEGVIDVKNNVTIAAEPPIADAVIKRRVVASLALNPVANVGQVDVAVRKNVVTLKGEVDTYFERAQAEQAASRVRGVESVTNELEVKRPEAAYVYDAYLEPYTPVVSVWQYVPPTTPRMDSDIRDRIVKEMTYSPFVDADQVAVNVVNGTATLTGSVDSRAESRAATENAYEGGAIRVLNQLIVQK